MYDEKSLEKLNSYQREAVLDESNACIVNANVGSGKTTVLISKIMYLHYVKKIDYRDMIVLTFTNKAAGEIKERLEAIEGKLKREELLGFGTFHSVALELLRSKLPVENLGYQKDFMVIEPDEEVEIALQLITNEKLTVKYKNRLKKRLEEEQVARYKDDLLQLKELLVQEKIKQNKMTFSDLIENAVTLLRETPIASKWIIIDEVQDSDERQLAFINALKKEESKLFAVGDPNQVIYSWRGSALNVFYTLKHRYEAKELSLPINYRSSASILEAAKCFLENGNSLTGSREGGSKVVVKRQYDAFQEACDLADRIKSLHEAGTLYKEIAIFYRVQSQSAVFENVFEKEGIPFEVSLKKTIGDLPVLNWFMKVLRFAMNEKDIAAGAFVLSHKEYGEQMTEKAATKRIKEEDKLPLEAFLIQEEDLLGKMRRFKESFTKKAEVDEKAIYEYFKLDQHLHPTASTYSEDHASVMALLENILTYTKEKKLSFLEGLADFINSSTLYGINILQKDIHSEVDSVKLMTLHASKGLEFSHVFITGVNEGLIPLNGKSFEEEEEERRLFFVGMTRAKDHLELSYYTNPDSYNVMPRESKFIRMIPERLIEGDVFKQEAVDLHELKRQILAERRAMTQMPYEGQDERLNDKTPLDETTKQESSGASSELDGSNNESVKKVSHAKYGIGKVISEDEMMIKVVFESYGEKEFIKAFSELEAIED